MNKYFDKNDMFDSNSRIYEGFFADVTNAKNPWKKISDFLFLILRFLSGQTVIRCAKATAVALSLIGFVGIIGAMENGALGLGTGLLIGALLLAVEYLCLRGHHRS